MGNKRAPASYVSDALREAIVSDGRSLSEIARRAGVSQSIVSRFVGRSRCISSVTFDRLAFSLGYRLVNDRK